MKLTTELNHHAMETAPGLAMVSRLSKFEPATFPQLNLSHLTLDSTLADLPSHEFEVGLQTPGYVIALELEQRPDLPGVIVKDGDKVVGAFSRRKFLERVGRPYGVEVYLKRPIEIMLKKIPSKHLQLPSSQPIHSAAQIALSRPAEAIYEPIVVEFPRQSPRLLNIYTLLLAQSQLLGLSYQLEQKRRQFAEALQKTGQALSSTLQLPQVTELILQELDHVVAYERGSVMLYRSDHLEIIAQRGFSQEARVKDIREVVDGANALFLRMLITRAPLLLGDVTSEPSWQQVPWLPLHHSWLGVPLIAQDRVIGLISLTRLAPNAFDAEDIELVQAFASQAAIALENAHLYDQILNFNNRLEQLVAERTQDLNRAYNLLEKIDKTKSDFIQLSAHELRTPLTVIMGYAQLLGINPALRDEANLTTMVEGIRAGVSRLHRIVNNILDVAKIASDNLTVKPEPIFLAPLLQRVCAGFTPDLQARNLRVHLLNLNTLPTLNADPDLLSKVFHSLLINAIKYTPDGGHIYLSGQVIPTSGDGSQVEIVVRDTGVGIEPDQLAIIFEKFYQTGDLARHSSGQTSFKGAGPGLGLAVAKGIVEAHGGQIWAESQGYDETTCPGSCFYVRLPLHYSKPRRTNVG